MRSPRFMQSGAGLRILARMPDPLIKSFAKGFASYSLWKLKRYPCPIQWTIFLTEACNLNCPHCFLGDRNRRQRDSFSLNDIERLCKKNAGRIRRLVLTGGEPFLLPDLEDMCFLFDRYMPLENLTLTTNAQADERLIRFVETFLAKAKTRLTIQISLDGPQSFHDEFRGAPGLFNKAFAAARLLNQRFAKHAQFERVYFGIVLTQRNMPLLAETIELIIKSGLESEWAFVRSARRSSSRVPDEYIGPWSIDNDNLLLSIDQMRQAHQLLYKNFWSKKGMLTPSDAISYVRMRRIIDYYRTSSWPMPCTAGRSDAVITAQGRVAVCEMTKPLGSLKDCDWDMAALAEKVSLAKWARSWGCSCAHECNINNTMRTDPSGLFEIIKALRRP